jgi:hypothetical protein
MELVFNTNHLEIKLLTNCVRLSNCLFFDKNGLLSFGAKI